jgi:hypothetical protein
LALILSIYVLQLFQQSIGHVLEGNHFPANATIGPGKQGGQRPFTQFIGAAQESDCVVALVEAFDKHKRGNGGTNKNLEFVEFLLKNLPIFCTVLSVWITKLSAPGNSSLVLSGVKNSMA